MNKKLIILTVLLAIAALAAAPSFAADGSCKQSKCDCGKPKDKVISKAGMILKHEDELGLSDTQVRRIKELKLNYKKESIKQNAAIEVAALDIKAKMWEDRIDVEGVNALIDKKYELKKEKAKLLVLEYAKLKNILSEKQLAELKKLYKEKDQKCKIKKGKKRR